MSVPPLGRPVKTRQVLQESQLLWQCTDVQENLELQNFQSISQVTEHRTTLTQECLLLVNFNPYLSMKEQKCCRDIALFFF